MLAPLQPWEEEVGEIPVEGVPMDPRLLLSRSLLAFSRRRVELEWEISSYKLRTWVNHFSSLPRTTGAPIHWLIPREVPLLPWLLAEAVVEEEEG